MNKLKALWAEFKKFIARGNIVDMAVGVVIGSAFTAIVNAVTKGVLMPLVNWAVTAATGGQGLEGLRTILGTPVYIVDDMGTQAVDWASTLYIDWGTLINSIVDFLLIALLLFTILKVFMALQNAAKGVNGADAKAKRKLIRANMKSGMSLAEATAKAEETIAAEAKAEADKKAAEEAAKAAQPTTEQLLTQIRDLLAAQNNNSDNI